MDDNLRRLIAFVCGCYVNKTFNNNQYVPTRIFDYEMNEYIPMNIQFNDYGFNLYDYGRCSYANGNGKYIYDFATKQTVCWYIIILVLMDLLQINLFKVLLMDLMFL